MASCALRVERAVELDAVRGERIGQRDRRPCRRAPRSSAWSAIVPEAAEEPNRLRPKRAPSSSAQFDEAHGHRRAPPPRRARRSTSTPATTFRRRRASRRSGRSRCARRSAARVSEAPRSVHHWLPAASTSYVERQSVEQLASHSRAATQVSVQATRWAPSLVAGQVLELAQLLDGAGRLEGHGRTIQNAIECGRDCPWRRSRSKNRAGPVLGPPRRPLPPRSGLLRRPLFGLSLARDALPLDTAVRGRRHHDAEPPLDRQRPLRAARGSTGRC